MTRHKLRWRSHSYLVCLRLQVTLRGCVSRGCIGFRATQRTVWPQTRKDTRQALRHTAFSLLTRRTTLLGVRRSSAEACSQDSHYLRGCLSRGYKDLPASGVTLNRGVTSLGPYCQHTGAATAAPCPKSLAPEENLVLDPHHVGLVLC